MAETALSSNQEVITERIREEDSGSFTVKDEKGSKYMVNVLPLIEGQWYQVSTVPVAVLRSSYIETARGIMAIILAACVLFIWLVTAPKNCIRCSNLQWTFWQEFPPLYMAFLGWW